MAWVVTAVSSITVSVIIIFLIVVLFLLFNIQNFRLVFFFLLQSYEDSDAKKREIP
jgi:hypothetical protein